MPKPVKMWGSITILSTMFTFIILGVIGWSGIGTLKAYDTAVDVNYVKSQMDTMNGTLTELVVLQYNRNIQTEKNTWRIISCEKHQAECEDFMHAK